MCDSLLEVACGCGAFKPEGIEGDVLNDKERHNSDGGQLRLEPNCDHADQRWCVRNSMKMINSKNSLINFSFT